MPSIVGEAKLMGVNVLCAEQTPLTPSHPNPPCDWAKACVLTAFRRLAVRHTTQRGHTGTVLQVRVHSETDTPLLAYTPNSDSPLIFPNNLCCKLIHCSALGFNVTPRGEDLKEAIIILLSKS